MTNSTREKTRSIQAFRSQLIDRLRNTQPAELTRTKRLVHSLLSVGVMIGQDFIENLVKLQAMALAFKTLLSLAPLLAVVFSILKAFGVHNRMEPALAEALAPLGEKGQEVTAHLIGFVDKMSAGALGSVGLATLFITVLSLMGTIEQAFNTIWRVRSPRKLARKFSDYLSVILVGPVLVFAALTVTATLQSNSFVRTLLAFEPFGTLILTLLRLVPYATLWGAFTFFYFFIPNTRVKLRSALIGGLVAALLWQTVGWAFTVFVASSTRYYAIYSSFAILLIFLLWLHVGWVIVLMGAQVAYAHQYIHSYRGDRETLPQSAAGREKLALHLIYKVGRNFHYGLGPISVTALATELNLSLSAVRELMEIFQPTRLVLPLTDGETFVLGRDPETISIQEILDCARGAGKKPKAQIRHTPEDDEIDGLLIAVDRSAAQTLEGKSLKTLIVKLNPVQSRA